MEGNPYKSLWDEISEESEQPDEQDVRWGVGSTEGLASREGSGSGS